MSQTIDTELNAMQRSVQPKGVGEHVSAEKTELEKQRMERNILRRKLSRWILLSMGALAVGAAALWWLNSRNYESTHDARIDGHVDLISARISGIVAYINPLLDNNQFVKAGTLLVAFDQRDYAAEFERAQANFDTRRAEVHSAQVEAAQIEAARSTSLQVADAGAKWESAVGHLEQAFADLRIAQLNLSYTMIYAPVSGVIGRKTVELGDRVQPGQDLLVIVPLDDTRIKPGQSVAIRIDTFGRDYKGRVRNLSGAAGPLSRVFPPKNATGKRPDDAQECMTPPIARFSKPGVEAMAAGRFLAD